jgi:crotonobetainyl-CoA:carnitine CoA-transferase CaiB-like acyl-CoA transferase
LQTASIAAGPVLPAHTLLEDPHLKSIGFWRRMERRYIGDHVVPKPPFAIDGIAPALHRPSPTLGQHNEEVLRDVVGLSPAEIQALERDGIIGTSPTSPDKH